MANNPRIWKLSDRPAPADFNRIEQGIADIEATTDAAVKTTKEYVDSRIGLYLPKDGSKPMTGNLQVGGNNGVQLGDTAILRASTRPSQVTLTAPGGVYANGFPVWTQNRTGYAMYNGAAAGGSVQPNGDLLFWGSGYDGSGAQRPFNYTRGIPIYDTGIYILTFACTVFGSYGIAPTMIFIAGSQQSQAFKMANGYTGNDICFSASWVTGYAVPSGSLIGVRLQQFDDYTLQAGATLSALKVA